MEERLKGWKEEQEEFSQLFRTLCLCRKKTLLKGNQEIVELVAKKQLTLLKRSALVHGFDLQPPISGGQRGTHLYD